MRHPLLAAAILSCFAAVAQAGQYDFAAAPQTDLNRVYRVDRYSGEVTACQYGLKEGSIGVTLCYGPGEGAAAQPAGEYGLVASRHEREGGVFRVNQRSGEMSVCYLLEDRVVCTPQAKAASATESTGTIGQPAQAQAAAAPIMRRN